MTEEEEGRRRRAWPAGGEDSYDALLPEDPKVTEEKDEERTCSYRQRVCGLACATTTVLVSVALVIGMTVVTPHIIQSTVDDSAFAFGVRAASQSRARSTSQPLARLPPRSQHAAPLSRC